MTVAAIQTISSQNRLHIADGLATAAVVLLPWSISLSQVLIVLWLITAIFALGIANIRREVMTAAGGLPVALFLLALVGTLWSAGSWAERLGGGDSFLKLLAIPILLAQFRHSARAAWPLIGFLASCSVLLALSWIVAAWPEIAFEGSAGHGVPLKSAHTQVREFVICAFALLYLAIDKTRASEGRLAAGSFALALAFLANIAYVTTNHWFIVPLVAIPGLTILLLLLACKQFGIGVMLGLLLGVLLACVMTYAVLAAVSDPNTWSVLIGISRPVFWSKSLQFIGEAPIFGHGTASIRALFAGSAIGQTGVMAQITANPYQETLAVGVQFGIIGIALLWAVWIAHLWLFRGNRFSDWIGLVVVIFAIVGSMVGSELFDFNQGWIYVFGVGIAGGMTLRARQR
jgi:O-antigen ligase